RLVGFGTGRCFGRSGPGWPGAMLSRKQRQVIADDPRQQDDGAKKEEKKEPPKDPKTLLIEQLSQTLRTISACVAAGETRAMGRVIRTFASTRRTMMPE
ncbi:unnamed protein product, partial [Prorocentrum cordatum]